MALINPNASDLPLSVLVFTPTPTHPPIQGNRQRIFDMCRAMQSAGAELSLLYYATEGLSVREILNMRDAWAAVEVVFPRGFKPRHRLVRYPAIDDWFDDTIGDAAARMSAKKAFDACVVNYAWYSKLFRWLPPEVVRVIDTHDVFGGRAQNFEEIDRAPEWFHTSVQEESRGLDRADFVIAIQDAEAEILRARTRSQVRTVGFLSTPRFLPADAPHGGRLKVGYVGSGNPFNVATMLSFARAMRADPGASSRFEVHVAGPICAALAISQHPFKAHGIVDSVESFYRSVDVVVNPMLGGTGLKIKSLEALSFGMPLVATRDAMIGIGSGHCNHVLDDQRQTVLALRELSDHPERLADEAAHSRQAFQTYRQRQLGAFSQFWDAVAVEAGNRRKLKLSDQKTGTAR